MRASYNNGDENRPKQEQPHSVETQGRKETKVYKEFKKFFWQSQRFAPGGYYTLNIISKHWLQAWRNKIKKNGPDPLPPINNDLLHPNPYGLRPKIFAQDEKYVLVNNLDVDYEYELCSDEAWAFFAGRYSHFQLPKTFYLNEQYNFVETVRLLSLNIALIDEEGDPYWYLLQLEETRFVDKLLHQICFHFNIDQADQALCLLDVRLPRDELTRSIAEDKTILGRALGKGQTLSFKHLKPFDAICLSLSAPRMAVALAPGPEGLCYFCRCHRKLRFKCGCRIASYCSVDCKYGDYLSHKFICPTIIDAFEDIDTDLGDWDQKPLNQGRKGLINIGNSCYLNCILQVVKGVPAVKDGLINQPLVQFKSSTFLMAFYHTMKKMAHFDGDELKPWPLKINLGLMSSNYLYYAQNDAAECIDTIINALNESGVASAVQVSDAFKGTFVTRFKCLGCGHVKVLKKEEPFFILALSLVFEKRKFLCEVFAPVADDRPLELAATKLAVRESDMNLPFIAKAVLPEAKDASKLLLLLADKQKVRVVAEASSPIEPLVIRQKTDEKFNQTIFYLHQLKRPSPVFLFLSFTELTHPDAEKQEKGARLCNVRPVEINEQFIDLKGSSVTGLSVHLQVFLYLRSYLVAIKPDLASFLDKFSLEKDSGTLAALYLKAFHYFDEFDALAEKLRSEQSTETPDKQEGSENPLEANPGQELAEFLQVLSNDFKPFDSPPYRLNYINRAETCANCGQADKHTCNLQPHSRPLPFRASPATSIAAELLIPADSPFLPAAKAATQPEHQSPAHSPQEIVESSLYTLNSSLETYFEPQSIERKCKHCNSNASTMSSTIKQFPQFLIIHLKRFTQKFEKNNYVQVKIEDYVEYDFELAVEGQAYRLVGVINHRGELDRGHYTSFAYGLETKVWLFYDDAKWEVVANPADIKSKDNYILFYQRVAGNE